MAGNLSQSSREQEIMAMAARQRGLLTGTQLISIGVGRRTIERWVGSGRLQAVHRNVFAVGPQPLTRHARWLAAVLAKGPGAVLSHQSAAALWRLAGDRLEVHVTAPSGRHGRGLSGIHLHRCELARDEWMSREGIPLTTVARTLFDLAETAESPQLRSAWDEADRLRLLRIPQVATIYERHPRRRARSRIGRFLAAEQRHVEDSASPLEERFAAFVIAHRLPPPHTNVLVDGDEVDVLWPQARLIVELDSWEFHAHRAAFEKDRNRDTEHLLSGYNTIRVTHRRLSDEPDRLAAQIRALLNSP
jgi:very-short-patch-repair endonuclease